MIPTTQPSFQIEGEEEVGDESAQLFSEEQMLSLGQTDALPQLQQTNSTQVREGMHQVRGTEPQPSLFKAHSQSLPETEKNSKVTYVFYYNGNEIKKKDESLFDLMQKYQNVFFMD